MEDKKVLVAPLNWGLGHATRCIPIIKALLQSKFTPVIASDGAALELLQKEFPKLENLMLPSYNIYYGSNLKISLLLNTSRILKAVKNEHKIINSYIDENKDVVGLISDNRFGVRSAKIPSVYVTHQLRVLSGMLTPITTKIHKSIIKKFDECWIPDKKGSFLSGELSSLKLKGISVKYIGILSRFKKVEIPQKNDVLIILSGPEPNRTNLETKILDEFKSFKGTVTLVRGVIDEPIVEKKNDNIKVYDYLLSNELEREINQSELIICRSGYSSIMDLATLEKKAFFIPTKNQNEQEYLAKHLKEKNIAYFESEQKFNVNLLKQTNKFTGFRKLEPSKFNSELLHLFERK